MRCPATAVNGTSDCRFAVKSAGSAGIVVNGAELGGRDRDDEDRANDDGTCIDGFVWREATPEDHICVTPEERSEAATQNRQEFGAFLRVIHAVVHR